MIPSESPSRTPKPQGRVEAPRGAPLSREESHFYPEKVLWNQTGLRVMPFTLPAHPFNFSEQQLHKLYNEEHRTHVVVSSDYESLAASTAGCLPNIHTLLSTSILTNRTRAKFIMASGLRVCPGPGPWDPRGIWHRPLWENFLPEHRTTLQRLLSLSHEDVQNKK